MFVLFLVTVNLGLLSFALVGIGMLLQTFKNELQGRRAQASYSLAFQPAKDDGLAGKQRRAWDQAC